MVIETARELDAWAHEALVASGAAVTPHAVQAVASVVWRHAIGQGLALGDDWGWVLELYDAAAIEKIAAASIEAQREAASRRRRRGY
jgi:hypothetical protein